jgi:hypothetical protein
MATSLLTLKGRFYRFLGAYRALVATGGGASSFTVASLADKAADTYKGWQLRVLTGDAAGDLRVLSAGPDASGVLTAKRAFTAAPAASDTAELWGNSIDGDADLTNLFNDILLVARPVDMVKVTIVDRQAIYDLSAYVDNVDDALWFYVRNLDPASERPHTEYPVQHCRFFVQGGKVYGELAHTLVGTDPATQELWLKYRKSIPTLNGETPATSFTLDTTTVDDLYADWLVWEAVLRHAVTMRASTKADKAAWEMKKAEASAHVMRYRRQFMPFQARPTRHRRPQYD